MGYLIGKLRRAVFGISPREALFSCRGFPRGASEAQVHLERAGMTFVSGYNAALQETNPQLLMSVLNRNDRELVGFAFEGAAMGLAILDLITPWNRSRVAAFLKGTGAQHVYMVHVGTGWALARLKRPINPYLERMDPILRWLVMDGYGFHQGYFHWKRFIEHREVPANVSGYATRVFDQGLGRALWFVHAADVERIPAAVGDFDVSRQADLWSGVGLACAYAGKVTLSELKQLRAVAKPYQPQLAQGAAFAAKARLLAGNATEYMDQACRELCGVTAQMAAKFTDKALENLPVDGDQPAFEVWRLRLHEIFATSTLEKIES